MLRASPSGAALGALAPTIFLLFLLFFFFLFLHPHLDPSTHGQERES
jgi:hypothetical protein